MLVKFILFICLSFSTYAQEITRFKVPKDFKANFSQERFIKSTDLTLNSSGTITIKNGSLLRWNQDKPFDHLIEMTKDSIKAGKEGELKELKEPMAKYMAQIMFNLFGGDLKKLESVFEVTESGRYISLVPKDKTMAKFIESIRVEGKEMIEKIKLKESSGNNLTISFTNLKVVN